MRFRFHRGPLNVYPVRTVAPRRRSVPAATGTARTELALLPVAALRLTSVVSMQDRHLPDSHYYNGPASHLAGPCNIR